MDRTRNKAALVLRWSLAFVFAYAAIGGFVHPENWIGYFPSFLISLAPASTLLALFGILELALAVWLIIGRKIQWAALASSLALLGITAVNLSNFDIVFRDLGLSASGLALALLYWPHANEPRNEA
jgi:uncharacterized membrane protein YphA (DoxX/SURF4 family)